MAENSEPSAHPAYYPLGGTFADFLCWHMDYWGTRPTGNTTINGAPWTKDEFRLAAFGSYSEEEKIRVGLGNWRGLGSAPAGGTSTTIINTFFGTNPVFARWRKDFEEAHKNSKGPGKNPRTKRFPDPPPVPTISPPIPRLTPYFTGRDKERDALVEAILADCVTSRAILIQGGPGMGKTELAKAVAHQPKVIEHFGERRWFVRLETALTTEAMQDAIMRALGLDPQLGFQATLNGLRGKRSLIVLDNLETPWEKLEVRSATEDTLAELSAVTGVSIIASFRGFDKIGGPFWYEQQLHGLACHDARELFASIAGKWVEADSEFDPFVDALGGIPLAIDLVARRAHGRASLAPLWAEWNRVGAELAQHPDFDEERLTSLPRSIEMSLRSIRATPEALSLFRLLGCLPAGMSREDLATLMADDAYRAEERLLTLGLAVERPGRVTLLPPIREHALRNCNLTASEIDTVASHYIQIVENLVNANYSEDSATRMEQEFRNIESIFLLECARGFCSKLVQYIRPVFQQVVYRSISTSIFEKLSMEFKFKGDISNSAWCIHYSGEVAFYRSDRKAAQIAFETALPLFRSLEDKRGQGSCLHSLGNLALVRSDHNSARDAYAEGLQLFQEIEFTIGEANCTGRLGEVAFDLSQYNEANEYFEKAKNIHEKSGHLQGKANCIYFIGRIKLALSEFHAAQSLFRQAIEIYRITGSVIGSASCIRELGHIAFAQSEYDRAREAYKEALEIFQLSGVMSGVANCLEGFGEIAIALSDFERALCFYEEARLIYRDAQEAKDESACTKKIAEIEALLK